MAKKRAERTGSDWSKPIPAGTQQLAVTEADFGKRLDSAPDEGWSDRNRIRTKHSQHIGLSLMKQMEMAVIFAPLWETAEFLQGPKPRSSARRVGRPSKMTYVHALVYEELSWVLDGYRAVERELLDKDTWRRLRRAVRRAWPNHPDRRLPRRPPTRGQFHYFQKKCLKNEPMVDQLKRLYREMACEAVERMGYYDPNAGSNTNPDDSTALIGDGTWERSVYHSHDPRRVDPYTGEITERRVDPDAGPFHKKSQGAGNMLTFAISPSIYSNERVVLDSGYCELSCDANAFTDMAIGLKERLPGIATAIYDMALRGSDAERLFKNGITPVHKLPRTNKNTVLEVNMGKLTFKTQSGEIEREVVAYDGRPCIIVTDVNGTRFYVPLNLLKVAPQLNRTGTAFTVYGVWTVPDEPGVPVELIGATTRISYTRGPNAPADAKNPCDYLRLFYEGHPTYTRLFGQRESVESTNHYFKSLLPGRRARCVGLLRRRLNVMGFQMMTCMNALIAWSRRTGGDLSRWFGEWRPPNTS